jgi:hypothetical protein
MHVVAISSNDSDRQVCAQSDLYVIHAHVIRSRTGTHTHMDVFAISLRGKLVRHCHQYVLHNARDR